MNHSFFHFTRRLAATLLVALLVPLGAWAQTYFEANGMRFIVIDETEHTAALTALDGSPYYYSGDFTIPATATDGDGQTWNVTQVEISSADIFYDVTKLTIPATVKKFVAKYSYTNYLRMRYVTEIVIEDSEEALEFPYGGSSYSTFYTYDNAGSYKVYLGRNLTGYTDGTYNVNPFYDGLSEVTIGPKVTALGEGMFRYAYNSSNSAKSLQKVTFATGSQLTAISEQCFRGCKDLTAINLPDGITTIGTYAFYECEKLTAFTFPPA